MLRLQGGQVESLWDEVLPVEVRQLPDELAAIDELLRDPGLFAPIEAHWRAEAAKRGRSATGYGRPTIPIASYVRLMVLRQRTGWGYETLVREVSDSLHLRRFCPRRDRPVPPGRVDRAQADPPARAGDGGSADPSGGGEGHAGAALPRPRRPDRLDRRRGRHPLPDRRRARPGGGAGPRPRGGKAPDARRHRLAGARPLPGRSAGGCGRSGAQHGADRARRRPRCFA